MSHIARMTGFPPCGAAAWALAEPPAWQGFAAPAPSAPANWWPSTAVLAADFAGGRYMRNAAASPIAAVPSTLRAAPAMARRSDDLFVDVAANAPVVLPGLGLYVNGAFTNQIESADLASLAASLPGVAVALLPGAAGPDGKTGSVYRLQLSPGATALFPFASFASSAMRTLRCWVKANGPDNRFNLRSAAVSSPDLFATEVWTSCSFSVTGTGVHGIANGDGSFATDILVWMPYAGAGGFHPSPLVVPPATTLPASECSIPDFPGLAAAHDLGAGIAGRVVIDVTRLAEDRFLFIAGVDSASYVGLRLYLNNSIRLLVRVSDSFVINLALGPVGVGRAEIQFQVKSGASRLSVTGLGEQSSAATFTMPSLVSSFLGASFGTALPLNGFLEYVDIRRAV